MSMDNDHYCWHIVNHLFHLQKYLADIITSVRYPQTKEQISGHETEIQRLSKLEMMEETCQIWRGSGKSESLVEFSHTRCLLNLVWRLVKY